MSSNGLLRTLTFPLLVALSGCQLSLRAPCLELDVAFCKKALTPPTEERLVHVDPIQPIESTPPPPEQKGKKFAKSETTMPETGPVASMFVVKDAASRQFLAIPMDRAVGNLPQPGQFIALQPGQFIQIQPSAPTFTQPQVRTVPAFHSPTGQPTISTSSAQGQFVVVPVPNGAVIPGSENALRWSSDPAIRMPQPANVQGVQWIH